MMDYWSVGKYALNHILHLFHDQSHNLTQSLKRSRPTKLRNVGITQNYSGTFALLFQFI
jgi:hypothetical protein